MIAQSVDDGFNVFLAHSQIFPHEPETTGVEPIERLLRQHQSFRHRQRGEKGCPFIHANSILGNGELGNSGKAGFSSFILEKAV